MEKKDINAVKCALELAKKVAPVYRLLKWKWSASTDEMYIPTEEDIFNWRWNRETKKNKPKTLEQFQRHMQDIFQDYRINVEPTKNAANYVVQKDENHHYTLNVQ